MISEATALFKRAGEPDINLEYDKSDEVERSGFIGVQRYIGRAEQNSLIPFPTLLKIGTDRLRKIKKGINEQAPSFLARTGIPLLNFIEHMNAEGSVKYPQFCTLGAATICTILPDVITARPLNDNSIDNMIEVVNMIAGETNEVPMDLIGMKLNTRWRGLVDFIIDESDLLHGVDSVRSLDANEARKISTDFVVGGYLTALAFYLRTEQEGFDRYHR